MMDASRGGELEELREREKESQQRAAAATCSASSSARLRDVSQPARQLANQTLPLRAPPAGRGERDGAD